MRCSLEVSVFMADGVSWRSSQTTAPTEVQVVPIEQARRDLSNGRTVTSVGPAVEERHHLLCAELMESEILDGEMRE